MLVPPLPLPQLLAATYLCLAAGCMISWCLWDKVASTTNTQGGRCFAASIAAIVVVCLLTAKRRTSASSSDIATSMEPRSRGATSCPTGEQYQYSTRERTRFDSDYPKVLGYPSSGGVLMLPLDIAVAEYLGIRRLEVVHHAADRADEDSFCHRLRLLGANWWESPDAYIRKMIGFEDMTEMEKKQGIIVGWPSEDAEDGLWILRMSADTAMLRMCVNMQERCELLERCAATFYRDPRQVEEFEGLFAEKAIKSMEAQAGPDDRSKDSV